MGSEFDINTLLKSFKGTSTQGSSSGVERYHNSHQTKKPDVKPSSESAKQPVTPPIESNSIDFDAVLTQIKKHIQTVSRDLQFTVSEKTGKTVITVLDSETQEVIRQIPPDEIKQLAQNLQDMNSGLLDDRA